jgi:hypothetical protein
MNIPRHLFKYLLAIALIFASVSSSRAAVFVSVGIAPPPLPVYEQPVCPADGYLWTPGYWAYGPYGYYWVPGTWVQPPSFGLLWTPGYWGWGNGGYFFNEGYWGPQVGFYGGINYGFGYGGNGYYGGYWHGGHFFYNTAYSHVNVTNIHNVYVNRTVVNGNGGRTSFNGGNGGVHAEPTAEQRRYAGEHHIGATSMQREHVLAASRDPGQRVSANGGKPKTLAADRPLGGGKTAGTGKEKTAAHEGGPKTENRTPETHAVKEHHTEAAHTGGPAPEHKTRTHTTEESHPKVQHSHSQPHAPQHASHPQPHAGPKPQGGGDHKDKH